MTYQQGPGKTQYKPQFSVKWDRSGLRIEASGRAEMTNNHKPLI